jgi:hypothetical protein
MRDDFVLGAECWVLSGDDAQHPALGPVYDPHVFVNPNFLCVIVLALN